MRTMMTMAPLLLGLVIFLGIHSVRIFAEGWRARQIARIGEGPWKGLYSLAALVGLVLIVWGYGLARAQPVVLWWPPVWTRHLAALLMLPAFVLLIAPYVPGNRVKAKLGHPMLLGTKLWAFAHLASNGTLADVALFGSFLLWAVFTYRAARRRDVDSFARTATPTSAGRGLLPDVIVVGVGVALWYVFTMFLHGWLFGVRPFG
jgi:uncharacterized membrane protein